MRTRAALPLTALVLAVVAALTLGSVGAATAAGITKSTVKKLAAKVVDKKAKNLSVAHAATADNATNLGGAAPSAYQDRAAHENLTTNTALTGGFVTQVNNPTGITVPAGVKFLHITGAANFSTGATQVSYWPALDASCAASGAAFDHRGVGDTTAGAASVSVDFLAPVTAGEHTIRMCAAATANSVISVRSFTAVTVAGGPTG